MLDIVTRHQFGVAYADRFGVDHRHAEMRFQLFGRDHVRIDLAAKWNDRLRALGDQFLADFERALITTSW